MKRRPELSHAKPTGLKQPLGHTVLFWFATTSIAATVLFEGSVGDPLANSTIDTL